MIWGERLTDEMIEQARLWDRQIQDTRLFDTPNYSGLHIEGRFEIGYHGELCVVEALRKRGLAVEHRVNTSGKHQATEILIHLSDRVVSLEVKTASKGHHRRIMFPADQRIDADYVCGARRDLPKRWVEIMGFASGSEALRWPVSTFGAHTTPTHSVEFKALMSPDAFIDALVPQKLIDVQPLGEAARLDYFLQVMGL